MSGFAVGQVVVCVNAPAADGEVWTGPVEGGVYTVRDTRMTEEGQGVMLAEIPNPVQVWGDGNVGEVAFHSRRFRPAVETSLDVFEQMLAPGPKELEPA